MNNRLSTGTRIVAAVCALGLLAVIFLPIWRIELTAPQYPEGLVLKIDANKLAGDVEIVNGLNHYIGMRTLHTKDFVEFQVLPYIFGLFALFGILSAVINRRWFYLTWTALFIIFAGMAIVDFYRWEYNYGHNLDPAAPLQVPGMSYQPPLIGYKQLLNFGAYSMPDAGGWIFIIAGVAMATGAFLEIRRYNRIRKKISYSMAATILAGIVFLTGCSSGPQPIQFGSDGCDFCKMIITDKRFGGEVVTKKGKAYKFDDIHCITSFIKSGKVQQDNTAAIYLLDFSQPGQFVTSGNCYLFASKELRSPMGSNTIAFSREEELKTLEAKYQGQQLTWNEVTR